MPASGLVIEEVQGVTTVAFLSAYVTDATTIQTIAAELYALVDQQARTKILLDFAAVRQLTTGMLGILISLQKRASAIGGRVVLTGIRPEVMRVFEVTRLDRILEIVPDGRAAF
jgi:anti-sigma B factor antagonist